MIYKDAPFPLCHVSTALSTESDILAAWFGGTHERHPDVCIHFYTLQGNNKWTTPQLVTDGIVNDTLRYPCWNPVLYELDNDTMNTIQPTILFIPTIRCKYFVAHAKVSLPKRGRSITEKRGPNFNPSTSPITIRG